MTQANPEWSTNFNGAMHSIDVLSRAALLGDVSWCRFKRFIDIGGAHGSVLNAVLLAVPGSTGTSWLGQPCVACVNLLVAPASTWWPERTLCASSALSPPCSRTLQACCSTSRTS